MKWVCEACGKEAIISTTTGGGRMVCDRCVVREIEARRKTAKEARAS